jgi:ABC-type Na+ efflux pump permease subunit
VSIRNVLTVAARDFLAVVRTKAFVIGLLFLPTILTLSSTVIPKLQKRFEERGERRFAVADFTGKVVAPLTEEMARLGRVPDVKLTVALESVALPAASAVGSPAAFQRECDRLRDELAARVRRDELFGYVVIGPDALKVGAVSAAAASSATAESPRPGDSKAADPRAVVYAARSLTAGNLKETVWGGVRTCIRRLRFADYARPDVAPETIDQLDQPPQLVENVVSGKAGEEKSRPTNAAAEQMVPVVTMILMMMGIMQSAGQLLMSTIEEKSNRVVEVLVSSISAFELLAGKVLGAWLVGLTMIVAWGGAGFSFASHQNWIRPEMFAGPNLLWFVFFFLAGYLLFASLYGSIGAMCSTIQDAQGMMMPVVILIMIPMLSMTFVMQNPESGLATALTFFPFSAPLIAVLRLTLSPPAPQWQIFVAAASVALTAWFMMWLGAKVFRTAILMTGKPPKLTEMWRMVRES